MATDKSAQLHALETSIQDSLLVVQQLFAQREEMRRRLTLYNSNSPDESDKEGYALPKLDEKSADETNRQMASLEDLLLSCAFEFPRQLKSLLERFYAFFQRPGLVWPYSEGVRTSVNTSWADDFLIEVRGLLEEAQDVVGEAVQKLPPPPHQPGATPNRGPGRPLSRDHGRVAEIVKTFLKERGAGVDSKIAAKPKKPDWNDKGFIKSLAKRLDKAEIPAPWKDATGERMTWQEKVDDEWKPVMRAIRESLKIASRAHAA